MMVKYVYEDMKIEMMQPTTSMKLTIFNPRIWFRTSKRMNPNQKSNHPVCSFTKNKVPSTLSPQT